jgi:hypothetical protein
MNRGNLSLLLYTHMRSAKPKLPLLRGCIVAAKWCGGILIGNLDVWCPICRRHHCHDWDMIAGPRAASHRAAHCSDGPYANTGYLISVWPMSAMEARGHIVRPGLATYNRKQATRDCTCGCRGRPVARGVESSTVTR